MTDITDNLANVIGRFSLCSCGVGLLAVGLLLTPFAVGGEADAETETEMSLVNAKESEITISGYVDTSVMARFGDASAADGTAGFPNMLRSPGRLYDVPARQNGFNLNAVSLTLEKPLDESDWSSGFRAQVLMGPDARLRNFSSIASDPISVGMNEAFVRLRAPLGNGLEARIGYFTSPLGYEVYDSAHNPNYSRSYGYYIEPKAHTGVTLKYEFTDWVSVMAGVGNNYSPFVNVRSLSEWDETYLAVVTFTGAAFDQPDATLTLGYTGGYTGNSAPTDDGPRIHNFYAGLHLPLPVDGLAVGLAYDYQANYAADVAPSFFFPGGPESTYANSTGLYLSYACSKWKFDSRVEYATGTAGSTILSNRDPFGSNKSLFGTNDNEFLGVTSTVGYSVFKNVITRLEFRWDRDLAGGVPAFGSALNPRENSFTLALNAIYLF